MDVSGDHPMADVSDDDEPDIVGQLMQLLLGSLQFADHNV